MVVKPTINILVSWVKSIYNNAVDINLVMFTVCVTKVWRSVTKMWRTQKVHHTIKRLIINNLDLICDEVSKYWKLFFLRLPPPRYAFAVAPLCLHFFISDQAKVQRRKSEGRANPPLTCIFEIIVVLWGRENIYKSYFNVSNASRRHLEHMPKETERRTFNKATVNV